MQMAVQLPEPPTCLLELRCGTHIEGGNVSVG
jgi:hypothetical protein